VWFADFVQKLIKKKQKIEVARFIQAYLVPTKIKPPISCIQENRLKVHFSSYANSIL